MTILILDTRHSKIENREPRIDFCVIKIKKGATHCFTGVQSSELAKKFTDNDLAEIKENKLKKIAAYLANIDNRKEAQRWKK